MALSYFAEKEDYSLNHIRARKIRDGYLVTTDYGSWAYLSEEEYRQVRTNNLKEPLLSLLKEKGIVLTQSNTENVILDYRKKWGYLFQGTSLHIVALTKRCNLNCSYCHASAEQLPEGHDMTEDTAKKAVDFIFQSPSEEITIEFQGGEPSLNFETLKYIVKYAKKKNETVRKNLKFCIVTNLTLMNDEKLDFLMKEKIGICTSFDGCKEVHNANRDQYDKVVSWIKKIKQVYDIDAMPITTKQSLPHYKEIVDEYVKLGLKNIWIKPLNNLGYAAESWKKVGITPEQFLEFWKNSLDYIVKSNKKTPLIENYAFILLKKILTKECVNFTDLETPCGAAIGQIAYNFDGDIYTCDEGRFFDIFKIGTVNDTYKKVLSSGQTACVLKASLNDNNPHCEVCAYKPYCGLCPVLSYAETGNIVSKIPDKRCDILMGMFTHIFDKMLFDEEYREVFMSWIEKS
ncbi:His-Xaa-Ser system radical SAM maturase HxsB [Candidatus Woesearchaeota archaeon]|nr:His-Xaa-Ser system radical SAM maturase HxsB [Candidatus Woesearchaeota archaeon]